MAPNRVPVSTQGEDTGRRGTRVRHGHNYENQDGKFDQGESKMLRY